MVDPGRCRTASPGELDEAMQAIRGEYPDADVLKVEAPHAYVLERGRRVIVHVNPADPAEVSAGTTYTTWVVEVQQGTAHVTRFLTKVTSSGDHYTLPPPPA